MEFYKIFTISLVLVAIGIFSTTPYIFSENTTQINILANTSTSCGESNSCYSAFKTETGQGSKIVWVNQDSIAHTITSGNPYEGADKKFDSGLIKAGNSFSKTFSEKGTFDYFCVLHPWAIGLVVVTDADYEQPAPKPVEETPKPAPKPVEETPKSVPTSVEETPESTNDDEPLSNSSPSSTGESLSIQVNLSDTNPGTSVEINVADADGNQVFTRTIVVDSNRITDLEFNVSDDAITDESSSPSISINNKEFSSITKTGEITTGTGLGGPSHSETKSIKSSGLDPEPQSEHQPECGRGTIAKDGVCVFDTVTEEKQQEPYCFLFWCW